MGTSTLAPPRTMRFERAVKFGALGVVGMLMLIPVAISAHAGLYDSYVDNPLSGWGMWGTFAIYLATRPKRGELAATAAFAAAMRIGYDLAIGERGYAGSAIIGMGAFLGPASLAVLGVRALGAPDERRAACRQSAGVIALLLYIGVCLEFYISFARIVLPRKLDYFLYNFDGSLGFQPAFAAGRLVLGVRPLFRLEALVYDSLGFWFALIYAFHAKDGLPRRISLLKLFIANAFIGFSLYFLFPAMGPKYAFPGFPSPPGAVRSASMLLHGVPNAMPSLHFGGTLLICWLAKPWKRLYRVTILFAALTALATLGLGEHYLVDLVVAVPYALAIFAFSANPPQRRLPLAIGAGLVLAWMFFLRSGIYAGPLSWALVVATPVAAFTLQRRLAKAIWEATSPPK